MNLDFDEKPAKGSSKATPEKSKQEKKNLVSQTQSTELKALPKIEQKSKSTQPPVIEKLVQVKPKPEDVQRIKIVRDHGYLEPFEGEIKKRLRKYEKWVEQFKKNHGGIVEFARSYKDFGIHETEEGVRYREWAPSAKQVALFGDFNQWNRDSHQCEKKEFGMWELVLKRLPDGSLPIKHNTRVKVAITKGNGQKIDRNLPWIHYLVQDKTTFQYDGVFWNPPKSEVYHIKHPKVPKPKSVRIYECHVGMSSEAQEIATYRYFADNILARIKAAGFNAIQLMAVMEHSYYGSFGYHVTNFFAVSNRSGTPQDFKYLVDRAHQEGLIVLMDLIHSHASSNVLDGLAQFDGTDFQYFHQGAAGYHKQWDSRLFDYHKYEVLRFLLSNLAWYMQTYNIDGFRYDAVTSILYKHHGINYGFSGGLHQYFGESVVDLDGQVYLMLANTVIHQIYPDAITIAQDVSGMPGIGLPVEWGGFGFNYRLNMSVPDKWIELLKEFKDEEWNMGNIVHTLTNRRRDEGHITYCESHDQAIVGDKTISMWVFGAEIYHGMDTAHPPSLQVDRGMSLHKMIRLISYALGGEGYLGFMGNEFGHPEWIDFPRQGNGFSHKYCRRQWSLCRTNLRYHQLFLFEQAMHKLQDKEHYMGAQHQYVTLSHEGDKLIVFEKGDLLFIFNFHPYKSYEHYRIGTKFSREHVVVLHSDQKEFGGYDRVPLGHRFPIIREEWCHRPNYIHIYIPSRTAIVLKQVDQEEQKEEALKGEEEIKTPIEQTKTEIKVLLKAQKAEESDLNEGDEQPKQTLKDEKIEQKLKMEQTSDCQTQEKKEETCQRELQTEEDQNEKLEDKQVEQKVQEKDSKEEQETEQKEEQDDIQVSEHQTESEQKAVKEEPKQEEGEAQKEEANKEEVEKAKVEEVQETKIEEQEQQKEVKVQVSKKKEDSGIKIKAEESKKHQAKLEIKGDRKPTQLVKKSPGKKEEKKKAGVKKTKEAKFTGHPFEDLV